MSCWWHGTGVGKAIFIFKILGEAHVGGLWPGIWLLGNLARATYVGSADWMWPWSFDTCDRALQKQQLVSKCSPQPHYGFAPNTGRGAPEIDILEAMPGHQALPPSKVGKPYFSTSLQVSGRGWCVAVLLPE